MVTQATSPAEQKSSGLSEVVRASAFYAIVMVFQRVATFILFPIYTHNLTLSEYGLLELMDQAVNMWGLLLGVQFASAIGYYYFEKESADWRNRVVSTTVFGPFYWDWLAVRSESQQRPRSASSYWALPTRHTTSSCFSRASP